MGALGRKGKRTEDIFEMTLGILNSLLMLEDQIEDDKLSAEHTSALTIVRYAQHVSTYNSQVCAIRAHVSTHHSQVCAIRVGITQKAANWEHLDYHYYIIFMLSLYRVCQ